MPIHLGFILTRIVKILHKMKDTSKDVYVRHYAARLLFHVVRAWTMGPITERNLRPMDTSLRLAIVLFVFILTMWLLLWADWEGPRLTAELVAAILAATLVWRASAKWTQKASPPEPPAVTTTAPAEVIDPDHTGRRPYTPRGE